MERGDVTIEDRWPLFGLRVRTPRLELRPADQDLGLRVAELAAAGIHDPATTPFEVPWTDVEPPELQRASMQFLWRCWGTLTPEGWRLPFAVLVDDEVVGIQDLAADHFATRLTVATGSWLGRAHQGQGLGTEMRATVLHLAFAGLGARRAETGAWHDNPSSQAVTRKLGYRPNGDRIGLRRGVADRQVLFSLDEAAWQEHRRHDIELTGLDPCLPLLGVDITGGGPPATA